MKREPISPRQRVNLLLDRDVVTEARALGINLSRAVGQALASEVKRERDRRWQEDNREWVAAYNAWYEAEGDPLAHLEPL